MAIGTQREASVFDRLGGLSVQNQVCKFWLQGRCNKNPCRFMHRESPPPVRHDNIHQKQPRNDNIHQNQPKNVTRSLRTNVWVPSIRKETLTAARTEPEKSSVGQADPEKHGVGQADPEKSSVQSNVQKAEPEERSNVRIAEPGEGSVRRAEHEKSSVRKAEPEESSIQKRRKAEPEKSSVQTDDNTELRNIARSRRMRRNAGRSRHMKREVPVLDRPSGLSVQDQVCNRNPCKFLHSVSPPPHTDLPPSVPRDDQPPSVPHEDQPLSVAHVNIHLRQPRNAIQSLQMDVRVNSTRKETQEDILTAQPTQCKYWVMGNCVHGDKCKDMHSWFCGSGFTMLAKLEGHKKAISGIALPSGCDKLYSVAKDGTMRAWDCNSGQCAGSVTTCAEVGCLMAEGPWVCVGFPHCVKAYNLQNGADFCLAGPGGLVCSMFVRDEKLFAGMEDGTILVWNWNMEKIPEPAGMMKEHDGAVCSVFVGGANRLYSASRDATIKVWDTQNLHCLQTLLGHSRDVISVLCWDYYLISASLDNTIKIWCATESGKIEATCEIKEDCGIISLCGIYDAEVQPILLCSCGDNTVRLYDLPSFKERGRIFSKQRVEVIEIGTGGLFFTGDASGEVSVWKLLGDPIQHHDS